MPKKKTGKKVRAKIKERVKTGLEGAVGAFSPTQYGAKPAAPRKDQEGQAYVPFKGLEEATYKLGAGVRTGITKGVKGIGKAFKGGG